MRRRCDAVNDTSLETVARQGDALAALCQEVFGDHSTVTRAAFLEALTTGGEGTRLTMSKLDASALTWATAPDTPSSVGAVPPTDAALDSVLDAIGASKGVKSVACVRLA